MADIQVDTWLYGDLAKYGEDLPGERGAGYANLCVTLPEGSTIADLLARLQMPSEARGVTFINGDLSAMPGLQPDLDHVLHDGDRVAFFHLQSMWPFQYRFGVAMIDEMQTALGKDPSEALHHTYTGE